MTARRVSTTAWEHPVERRLRAVMARFFAVRPEALRPDAMLHGTLARDGLDAAALTRALEAELEVRIPHWAVDRMRTYGDLSRTVHVVCWARAQRRVRAAA